MAMSDDSHGYLMRCGAQDADVTANVARRIRVVTYDWNDIKHSLKVRALSYQHIATGYPRPSMHSTQSTLRGLMFPADEMYYRYVNTESRLYNIDDGVMIPKISTSLDTNEQYYPTRIDLINYTLSGKCRVQSLLLYRTHGGSPNHSLANLHNPIYLRGHVVVYKYGRGPRFNRLINMRGADDVNLAIEAVQK